MVNNNLRLLSVTTISSSEITARFTDNLNPNIDISNVSIISQLDSVPDAIVLKVNILNEILTITSQPLIPLTAYYVKFQSSNGIIFCSLNGTSRLLEDGVTNQQLIIGPIEDNNVVQDFLTNYLRNNIYDKLTDSSSIINSVIQAFSQVMSKSLYDIRQIKNENYLSFNVIDEQKTRTSGPFDRLLEEGAFNVLRLAKTKTNTSASLKVNIPNFGISPISLLAQSFDENLTKSSIDGIGFFNINSLILTVSNHNVSKLTSLTFLYNDGRNPYIYNISIGYQILNSRYDQDNAFSYAILADNQFKINASVIDDPLFSTQNIFQVQVGYEYRNLGRIIDDNSVSVSTTKQSIREILPPIVNVFNLQHAPILDNSGNIATLAGVSFQDLNAPVPGQSHPAFLQEIVFRLNAPPAIPGNYSIDYATGTVYVFGSDLTVNGTGPSPPVATYNYLFIFQSELDYVFDVSSNDLVALSRGNLLSNSGNIAFNYEEVLIPGIDYKASLHIENLTENIGNNLLALNVLAVKNSPITNVFRIFNQTTGEIYNVIRWFNEKVYFNFNHPPNIVQQLAERPSFETISNELLFVDTIFNSNIFKCPLRNDNIIAATEDGIGSSTNSSVFFSSINLFQMERWFDINESETLNISHLLPGQFQIDYKNGIVYVKVNDPTNFNIGTITYKAPSIIPQNRHVISVDDIYYRINLANPKDKAFTYRTFGDGFINPSSFDISDEGFLNGNLGAPYQISNGQIGSFIGPSFATTVSNNVNFVRGLFEFADLKGSTAPFNFVSMASVNGRIINVIPFVIQQFSKVLFDGMTYYVLLNLNLPYLSPNLIFTTSIIRNSDQANLWDNNGIIIPGNVVRFNLSGINSPAINNAVSITFSIAINNLSRIILDYDKGNYFIDYAYLADEIIVSYEYGENHIDFSQSLSLSEGDQYYVSYQVGALRDALLKNFGTLVNIPDLSTFETDFERERYRDALSAALESFIQGPTISALKNICNRITHIEPTIIESAFQNWSLASSLLNPRPITTTGSFQLIPAKYDNGIVIDRPEQTITFPFVSNFKLEQGSFETWIEPQWNGIDNDALLTFSVTKDGYDLLHNHIFIGAGERHPSANTFTISKLDEIAGSPNMNKDGVFIFYDDDPSHLFKRWFVNVVDGYSYDGYHDGYATTFQIKIGTSGSFYDVKSLTFPQPSNLRLTSGNKFLTMVFSGAPIDEGVTFISDLDHYLLDFGEDINRNRFSLFKDASGYLTFKVSDREKSTISISADVSDWRSHDRHHMATSWKLNNRNERDELHLFIDGLEVPNIIRYGNKVNPYLHEKYRTINPEEIAGVVTSNIIASTDLIIVAGQNTVSSSLNFTAYGILPGGVLFIDEIGFLSTGYLITNVNGNTLTLITNMPLSLTNGRFSVNRTSLDVLTEIDIYPNIAISTMTSILNGTDMMTVSNSNIFTSVSTNFTIAGIKPGYLVRIDNLSFENHYVILSVSGHSLTVNGNAPLNLSSSNFHIYTPVDVEIPGQRAVHPSYSISTNNGIPVLTLSNNVKANDLILIKTLGINHRRINKMFYQWGNQSNIIATILPTPISLASVNIGHTLLSTLAINTSNSSSIGNSFTSNNFATDQPSISDTGRTLSITISGNNTTFPIQINISGIVNGSPIIETISFNQIGVKNTLNKFSSVSYVNVSGAFILMNKTFLTLNVKEAFPITTAENSSIVPVIRYSYQTGAGVSLSGNGGTTVTDLNGFFSNSFIGNYLIITSPLIAAGTYQIIGVSSNHNSLTLNTSIPSFTNGSYQVLSLSAFQNGFHNGFFVLEQLNSVGTPYLLTQGLYSFDYYSYLSSKMSPIDCQIFIGSDFNGENQINATLDETKITSLFLTDTRIGETIPSNQESITKDFNSFKALKSDPNTLFLCHYDSFPLTNDSSFYIGTNSNSFVQSGNSPNENFGRSIVIIKDPLIIDNTGILNPLEGTIEFWASPLFDTSNDPNQRYFFDASAIAIQEAVSLDEVSVKIPDSISKILSVKLVNGDSRIDYFAGGRVEIDTQGAIAENTISMTSSSLEVSKLILEVISVKIVNDPLRTDYFANGVIGTDGRTIFLGKQLPSSNLGLKVIYKPINNVDKGINSQVIRLNKALPNTQTPVVVSYIPAGAQGDRISIYKDPFGYVNFDVRAATNNYVLRAPIAWSKGTWHRIKATFRFGTGIGEDTIRLFVDGYEYGNIQIGTGLIFGQPFVPGSITVGKGGLISTIPFKDAINELFIGADFTSSNPAFSLIDNLRISNIARPVISPFGESIDVSYNSNISVNFPVVKDLYTTFLLNLDDSMTLTTDFTTIQNRKTGMFDFTVNVFDDFDILSTNAKSKQILETLIKTLKPGCSRAFINYQL